MLHIFADENESNYWAKVFLCALLAGLVAVTLTACSAKSDEEITAAAERVAYEKKITFTMPLEYTATVRQCNTTDGCKTRHYFPSSKARQQWTQTTCSTSQAESRACK